MSSKRREFWRREIRWLDGKLRSSPRFPRTSEGKQAADHWYNEQAIQKKMILSGVELEFQARRLDEFSKEWLAERVYDVEEVTWREEKAKLLNRILPKFGMREMHTIRSGEVTDWLRGLLKEGLHETTVDHHRAVLMKILNDAIRHDPPHLKNNPIEAVRKYSKYDNRKKPEVWSEEQCREYLAACHQLGALCYLAMMFFVNTGGRQSEIIALRHKDIDLSRSQLTIRRVRERKTGKLRESTKSGKERTLGMNAGLLEAYEDYLTLAKSLDLPTGPDDLVLTRIVRRKGSPWTAATVAWWHAKAMQLAKLPRLTPHGLRHTFASLFAMRSGSTRAVQGLLGHASAQTTERYTHFLPGHLASQAEVVSLGRRPEGGRSGGKSRGRHVDARKKKA